MLFLIETDTHTFLGDLVAFPGEGLVQVMTGRQGHPPVLFLEEILSVEALAANDSRLVAA